MKVPELKSTVYLLPEVAWPIIKQNVANTRRSLIILIDNFRYIKIQPETKGIISRLWGINMRICMSSFPRASRWCLLFRTEFEYMESGLLYAIILPWGESFIV